MELKDILNHVNEWLRYAEAKNATIAVFDSAVCISLLALVSEGKTIPFIPDWYLYSVLLLFLFSATTALISFLPLLAFAPNKRKKKQSGYNPLFFGHIAKVSEPDYTESLKASHIIEESVRPVDGLIINQIHKNAKIAVLKNRVFSVSLWAVLAAFLTPIVLIVPLVKFFYDRKKSNS